MTIPDNSYRTLKIVGAAWRGLAGLTFALVFVMLFPLFDGNTPSPSEADDEWWIVVLVFLAAGVLCVVSGLALLRRNPVARPLVATTSLVLLLPSAGLLVPLLVVAPSLRLTLSGGGKKAFEGYMAGGNG